MRQLIAGRPDCAVATIFTGIPSTKTVLTTMLVASVRNWFALGIDCLHVPVGAEHEPRLDSAFFRDRRHRKRGDPSQGRRREVRWSTALTPSSDRLRGVGRCWLRKPTGAEKERRVGDTARYPRIASSTPATITPSTMLCPHPHEKTEGGDIVGWCPRSTARERRACARADDSTAICLTSICAPASFDPPGAVEVRVQILRLHLDLLASIDLEDNPFSRASHFGSYLRRTDARERTLREDGGPQGAGHRCP